MPRFRHHNFRTRVVYGRAFAPLWPALALYFVWCSSSVERPISRDVSTPDALAQNALNTILGDVQQEIAAGSNATYYTDANGAILGSVYLPVNPSTAVLALALKGQPSSVTTFAANLIKRSAYQQNFFPGSSDASAVNYNNGNTAATVVEPSAPGTTPSPYTAPYLPPSNRAANVSSAASSQNGFTVLPARWNKTLLLPKAASNLADPTNLTPDSNSFVSPDWVLLARNGSNPTNWSPSLQTSTSNPASVIGRYAYTVYDEGGLLDLSSAGYATGTDARQVGYKNSLASADLTQAALTQSQVDSVVNRRNSQAFAGRQDLISFFTQTLATNDATRAALQNSLQYFGVFSRGLNQPSYAPVSRVVSATNQNPRPLIQPSTATGGQPGGGNNVGDAYTTAAQQDIFSPTLLSVRAEAAFTRNDGTTTAAVGEPLLKSRFALQRLAWLTYLGPSATRNFSDVDMQQLVNTYGLTAAYLQQGTAANIQSYFGLTWDATNHRWNYNVHNGGSAGSAGTGSGSIMKLRDIADQQTREPDFFELLKTTVDPGAIGKAGTSGPQAADSTLSASYRTTASPLNQQFARDISLDAAIVQLGANIIDQFDVDGYSTHIIFNDGTGQREFRGVENLPYLYRVRTGALKIRESNPLYSLSAGTPGGPTSGGSGSPEIQALKPGTDPSTGRPYAAPIGYTVKPLLDTGVAVLMAVPDIWNLHDQNCSLGTPRPTSFQMIANSTSPDTVDGFGASGTTPASTFTSAGLITVPSARGSDGYALNVSTSSFSPTAPNFSRTPTSSLLGLTGTPMTNEYNNPHVISPNTTTTLSFQVPDNTFFREPTMLSRPNLDASQLTMSIPSTNPANADLTGLRNAAGTSAYGGGGLMGVSDSSIALFNPLGTPTAPSPSQLFCGIWLGNYPLRWVGAPFGTLPTQAAAYVFTDANIVSGGTPTAALTYSMQYLDSTGKYVTYDEKYVDTNTDFENPVGGTILVQPKGGAFSFVDPRTSRFASPKETNVVSASLYRAPLNGSTANWIYEKTGIVVTERSSIDSGFGSNYRGAVPGSTSSGDWGAFTAPGIHYQNVGPMGSSGSVGADYFQGGLFAQNTPYFQSNGFRFSGDTPGIGVRDANFWSDPDGVVRRATGAYVTSNSTVGQPLATSTAFTSGVAAPQAQSQSRPMILNRPFRSVAELGYVFSGNPWKNIDFSTPESGYSELLDVFCVNEPDPSSNVVAGKVNLNTRQPVSIQALLAGAYTDEENNFTSGRPSWSVTPLAGADAQSIASLLVARTSIAPVTGVNASKGPQPLQNVGDLAGRWNSNVSITGTFTPALGNVHNVDGSKSYDGFSADLTSLTNLTSLSFDNLKIPRLRESAVRALSNVGNTRVWNLMIDVIAQTGEYATSATSLDQFTVEGSQRYWLHVAVDRLTGAIVDQSMESVSEVTPTDLTLTNTSVAETQAAGTPIGTLGAVDTNTASVFSYALVSGTGGDDNASFAISGSTLQTNTAFRYLDKNTYHIRVREADQDGMSFEKAIIIAITPSAYTQWKIANFGNSANDPAVAGDLVDADGDGMVNLLEYALGKSPLVADGSGVSVQRAGNTLQFNYTKRSAATDITAHVYANTDLTNANGWSTSGVTETMLSDDGTLQHWQATLSLSSGTNAFMRLQVTKP